MCWEKVSILHTSDPIFGAFLLMINMVQVELTSASLRPAQIQEWADTLKARLLAAVSKSAASITLHSSDWSCDLDQVSCTWPRGFACNFQPPCQLAFPNKLNLHDLCHNDSQFGSASLYC